MTVELPKPARGGSVSVEAALAARRSLRDFGPGALTVAQAGQLAWALQGASGPGRLRTAPSAGAIYPLQVLLVTGSVTDLPAGIYRYTPGEHGLARLIDGDRREPLAAAALGQPWITGAPATFVLAGSYAGMVGRYGERGIRYVHMEAGHAAQNLALQAAALGLGSVVVGAFHDGDAAAVLPLEDGYDPLYLIPVGHPQP